ncbi:MAG: phytanoyl-CoA dioxygenase family protein [Gemmatimonadaceae bacterium]|nr:phytanoyl-CoA dioxygenase family protein [Gemmatimonadaceae bacterium]
MSVATPIPTLHSNGCVLTPDHLGWLEPTEPATSRAELWVRYREHGYLWLTGILDRAAVLRFRARFFEAFRETGMLDPAFDTVDGVHAVGTTSPATATTALLEEVVRWASFEAFCLAEPILAFYEEFLGGAVFLHRRKLVRFTLPGDRKATTPHYDLIYLRGGTERLCTSWIPIGDIPVEMGGLIYLERSHRWGRLAEEEFRRAAAALPPEERISAFNRHMNAEAPLETDLHALAARASGRWLAANYAAGDMLVHDPYLVHAATENHDPARRIRLSTDIRYQRVRDEVDARWQHDWTADDRL